jgi:hypothetical protein
MTDLALIFTMLGGAATAEPDRNTDAQGIINLAPSVPDARLNEEP